MNDRGRFEDQIAIFEDADGRLYAASRGGMAHMIASQLHQGAYEIMRHQVKNSACQTLRELGCAFPRMGALMDQDWVLATGTSTDAFSLMIADAEDFAEAEPSASASGALAALRHLRWQSATIEEAPDGPARQSLIEMALCSTSLGFTAAHTGIKGVTPSMTEMEQATAERLRQRDGRGAHAKRVAAEKVEAWLPQALAKAKSIRKKDPWRSVASIAEIIHDDKSIRSPSVEQVTYTLRRLTKEGKLAKKSGPVH